MTLLSSLPLGCAWIITALVALQPVNAQKANAELCSWDARGSPFSLGLSTCPLPIDDKTAEKTGNWAPWSHRPYCVTPANWPKSSPRLCVFTAANFRGQNGLSLLVTPELAASIADRMDDSLIPPEQRDHPASPLSPDPDVAYTVEELPGRGKGIVASRKIRKWETVLLDFPAIIVQRDYHAALNKKQKETMLQKLVNQLPKAQRDEVLSLSRDINGEMVEGILRSNVFSVDLTQVPFGLYPRGSRFNHACRPNAYWRFSKASLAQEFIAMQDIEEGEEVTQSYAPIGLLHEGRKKALDDWGFTCKCALCSSTPAQIEKSDRNKDRIREIFLAMQKEDPDSATITDFAREAGDLVDEESMWPALCQLYQAIASAYIDNLDFENADKYVEMAEDMCMQIGGEDQGGVQRAQTLSKKLGQKQKKSVS